MMKIFKPTYVLEKLEELFVFMTNSNKVKYLILVMLAYLVALTLTACETVTINPDSQAINNNNLQVSEDFTWSTSQHFLLKIQINPDFNYGVENYEGFPIDILSEDHEMIMRGALNENGYVRFDIITPISLEKILISSPVTHDVMAIENPKGSAVVGFRVKKFDATGVKGINHDKDQDGIFDQYDSFPEDNTKAFRNRVPYKGYINHVFEENWPKTDDFDYNDFVSSTVYYLTKDANGSLSMIDYEITIHENGGSGENGFGLQILSLGKLNSGNLTDLSQINEDLIILNDEGGQIRNDNDAPGSIIIVDANQTAENIPQEIAFSVDLSKLDYKVELGIYSDFFLFNKKNRGLEIHGPTGRPTQAMDKAFLNTMDDASNPAYDQFFRTAGNLPWALEIWNDESISPAYYDMVDGLNLMEIYPAVKNWIETDGIENKDWHNDLVTGKIKNL